MEATTHRIEIPDEYGGGWVDIRDRLGMAQELYIESRLMRATVVRGKSPHVEADFYAWTMAKLRTYIVAWSLPIPADHDGFESQDFNGDLSGWIIREAEAHYAERRRTKSGLDRIEPDAGRPAGDEQGADGVSTGTVVLPDRDAVRSVPARGA